MVAQPQGHRWWSVRSELGRWGLPLRDPSMPDFPMGGLKGGSFPGLRLAP